MKKSLITIFLFAIAQISFGQVVFENFDKPLEESGYIIINPIVTPNSQITLYQDTMDVYEGDAALGIEYSIPAALDWGGNAVFQFINPDTVSGVWDFSDYYSLSFAINNKIPSSQPSLVDLRIILNDISDAPTATKRMLESEFWVSFLYVLELEPGWNSYNIPFIAVSRSVAEEKPSSGFWHSDEIGVLGNDKLDLDKIAGITLEFHMSVPQDDSTIAEGTVLLDDLVLESNTTSVNDNVINPHSFSLEQNYPNPFNPVTRITYTVPVASNISLTVYDALGREIKSLVNEEKSPGNYTVQFDGTGLSSGIYFYLMKANNFIETKKLILLK
jgi:hypothetical protein